MKINLKKNICENCYNVNRKKYNESTLSKNGNNKKKTKVIVSENNKKNRTQIVGFSICGKSYLMNHILLRKQTQFL